MHGYHPDAPHSYASLLTNHTDVPANITAIPDMYKLMTRDAELAHAVNRVSRHASPTLAVSSPTPNPVHT